MDLRELLSKRTCCKETVYVFEDHYVNLLHYPIELEIESARGCKNVSQAISEFGIKTVKIRTIDIDLLASLAQTSITSLSIRDVTLAEDALNQLSQFGSLTHLHLSGMQVTESCFAAITTLKSISIYGESSTIAFPPSLGNSIEILKIKEVIGMKNDAASKMAACSTLKRLVIDDCRTTDEFVELLSKSNSIRHLSLLESYGVGDRGAEALAKMESLEKLEITATRIGDAGILSLANCTSLTGFKMRFSKCPDDSIAFLIAYRPLRVLGMSLSDNPACISAIHDSTTITSLDVYDPKCEILMGLTRLRKLKLSCDRIDKGWGRDIGACTSLEELHVSSTNGADVSQLRGNSTLTKLSLLGDIANVQYVATMPRLMELSIISAKQLMYEDVSGSTSLINIDDRHRNRCTEVCKVMNRNLNMNRNRLATLITVLARARCIKKTSCLAI